MKSTIGPYNLANCYLKGSIIWTVSGHHLLSRALPPSPTRRKLVPTFPNASDATIPNSRSQYRHNTTLQLSSMSRFFRSGSSNKNQQQTNNQSGAPSHSHPQQQSLLAPPPAAAAGAHSQPPHAQHVQPNTQRGIQMAIASSSGHHQVGGNQKPSATNPQSGASYR